MSKSPISCHSFDCDLIDIVAKEIAANHQQQFPFLQNVIVLLPNFRGATDLQQKILREFNNSNKSNTSGMAGPKIGIFKDYIDKTTTLEKPAIPHDARELILIDALQQHKNLFGQHNLLTTAYALLELFDELTRKQITLPQSFDEFILQLQLAYQCKSEQQTALSKEAQIVHTLWLAWHQQLKEINSLDKESEYQLKLAKNLQQDSDNFYYIAGFYDFLPAEIQWINAQLTQGNARVFFHAESVDQNSDDPLSKLLSKFSRTADYYSSSDNNNQFFQLAFNHQSEHFQIRASQAAETLQPIADTLKTFSAKSFEEEAQAITLQIRIWLNEKKTSLALILEDRRLARRVRALLQRSGIGMKDASGWAISTTTAASVLESWLQCIEENFHYAPLLDVLKSPFAFIQSDQHSQLVFRFEQDLVFHENIARDLNRYQQSWISRQKRLGNTNSETSTNLLNLFEQLSEAAKPIQIIQNTSETFLSDYLQALKTSLTKLNAHQLLAQDEAGKTILSLLDKLEQATSHADIKLDWVSFRHWLGLKLEENNFTPGNPFEHSIELLHLSQTTTGKFDAIIVGGMTKDQFPGAEKQTPFFNYNVRQELGLNSTIQQRQLKFYYFRYLLGSCPSILLSFHSGPQEFLPSPWLELLSRFHQLAFSENIENQRLHEMLQQQKNGKEITTDLSNVNTLPVINQDLLPDSLSASAHQTLIQCPYAFFAGQILKLRATDEVSEKLAKSDYGERIHLCLQAFHAGGINSIDGPFREKISETNKLTAINFLEKISAQVFAVDLEDNFQHRGWLKRWLKLIPAYIDWQMQHEKTWQFKSGEIKTSSQLETNIKIHGRIDRVDQSQQAISIMDYKTGSIPHINDVNNGEAVQLIHYALSNPQKVSRVEYLQFESGTKEVAEKCIVENEMLDELANITQQRLSKMYQDMKNGTALPAWGNDEVCQYCQFDGLCRHKFTRGTM